MGDGCGSMSVREGVRLCGACLSGGVSVVVMRGYGNMSVREGVSDVCVNVCERGLWGISVSESVCGYDEGMWEYPCECAQMPVGKGVSEV